MTCTARRHDYAAYSRSRCRCPLGREAWRLYGKRRREGRQPPLLTDATGSQRRLQGLLALGWPREDIATAAGLADQARVRQIMVATQVRTVTAEGIRRAAMALGSRRGPSEEVRAHALAAGYVSLWAWDDDIDNPDAKPQGVLRPAKPMVELTPSMVTRFRQYSVPELGGPHVRWTGSVDERGRGRLGHGPKDHRTTVSARRVAFVLHHRREPAGPIAPACGNSWCVAGPCMVDDTAAAQQKAAA